MYPLFQELCISKQCDDLPPAPPMILRTSPRKLLTQANLNTSVLQGKPPPPHGLSPSKHGALSPPKQGVVSPSKQGGVSPSKPQTKSLACHQNMPPPPPPIGTRLSSTPHKITSPPSGPAAIQPPTHSPSSALSTLSINSPKTNTRGTEAEK